MIHSVKLKGWHLFKTTLPLIFMIFMSGLDATATPVKTATVPAPKSNIELRRLDGFDSLQCDFTEKPGRVIMRKDEHGARLVINIDGEDRELLNRDEPAAKNKTTYANASYAVELQVVLDKSQSTDQMNHYSGQMNVKQGPLARTYKITGNCNINPAY